MENILNYPSDSDSNSQKYSNKQGKPEDLTNQNEPTQKTAENNDVKSEEFEDLNYLVEQEGLLVDPDLDIQDLVDAEIHK
jgi:hypothetical protein